MSRIALTPNASGTGTLTIAAPNTNTDRTLTLPDATGTVLAAPAGAVTISSSAPSNSLTVDGSGNLGLGVTPSAWDGAIFKSIDIGGVYKNSFYGQANGDWTAGVGTNHYYTSGWKYASTGAASRYEVKSNQHAWYTAPSGTAGNAITFTQAMTLDASGNLLVGTTSTINGHTFRASEGITSYRPTVSAGFGIHHFYSDFGSTQSLRAYFTANGGLSNFSANNVNLSDERVKTDIFPVGSYWDKVKALQVVTYKYRDQGGGEDNIGVIAQQVESVAPEFVCTSGFGETPADGVPLKSIYETDLHYATLKALQEAMARIEELTARVAELEAK